jgi:hypothetical protein
MKDLSHFPKTDIRFWQKGVFRQPYTVDGEAIDKKRRTLVSDTVVNGSSFLLGLRTRQVVGTPIGFISCPAGACCLTLPGQLQVQTRLAQQACCL